MNTSLIENVEISVGGEELADMEVSINPNEKEVIGKKMRTHVRQICTPTSVQVVLTRAGWAPRAIKKFSNGDLAVPVIPGNIIAQAVINKSSQLMIHCAIISAVDGDTLSLYPAENNKAFETIEKHYDRIVEACFTVLSGEQFAFKPQYK